VPPALHPKPLSPCFAIPPTPPPDRAETQSLPRPPVLLIPPPSSVALKKTKPKSPPPPTPLRARQFPGLWFFLSLCSVCPIWPLSTTGCLPAQPSRRSPAVFPLALFFVVFFYVLREDLASYFFPFDFTFQTRSKGPLATCPHPFWYSPSFPPPLTHYSIFFLTPSLSTPLPLSLRLQFLSSPSMW